jgi:hypothetical protein
VLLDDTLAGEVDKGLLGAVRDSIVQVGRADGFLNVCAGAVLCWMVLGASWMHHAAACCALQHRAGGQGCCLMPVGRGLEFLGFGR